MFKRHDPPTVARPASLYSHAVELPAGVRTLLLSGQVPVRVDGTVPADFAGQYAQVWSNIENILASAGMSLRDVARMVTYVTRPEFVGPARDARDALFKGLRVASTLVVVSALASPQFLVEIEVTAAQAD